MNRKEIKTRIQHKHGTAEDWSKSSLVPLMGEFIVYEADEDHDHLRFKIGDGETNVNDLPFITDNNFTVEDKDKLDSTSNVVITDDVSITEDTLLVINPDGYGSPDKVPEWYNGAVVTGTGYGIFAEVTGSAEGDYYVNTETFDIYYATAENTWRHIGNIKGDSFSYEDFTEDELNQFSALIAEDAFALMPEWARSEEKPTYTAQDVGADPVGSAAAAETAANEYTNRELSLINYASSSTPGGAAITAENYTEDGEIAAEFAVKAAMPMYTDVFASDPVDNTLYVCTVNSAVSINAASTSVCPLYGAHYILTIASGGSVSITPNNYKGDDISVVAVGDIWEISILCGNCLVKLVKEAE